MSDANGSDEKPTVTVPPPPPPPPPAPEGDSGAVPPVPPPPVPAPKARGRRTIAWVAGGVVVVLALAAGGLWIAGVLTASAAATAASPIRDIAQEPTELWKWTPEAPSEIADYVRPSLGVSALGGKALVTSTNFDYDTWFSDGGYDPDWYPGYDEQYDAAYEAGMAYAEAMAEYYNDFWGSWPDPDDYLPAGVTEDELYISANRGYSDGFYDGQYGGDTRLVGAPAVDFAPAVVALDAADGSALWTHEISAEVDLDSTSDPSVDLVEVPGGERVIFVTDEWDSEAETTRSTVTLLDASTGTTVGSVSFDDSVSSVVATRDAVFVVHWPDEGAVVTALAADDLSGEPLWEEDTDGNDACLFTPDVLAVGSWVGEASVSGGVSRCSVSEVQDFFAVTDGSRGLDLRTGDDIGYIPLGSGYLEEDVAYDEDTGTYEGEATLVDLEGEDLWEDPIPIDESRYVQVIGGRVFYGSFSDEPAWTLLDPKTGQEAWDYEVEDGTPIANHGDYVVVLTDRDLSWVDAKSGFESFDVRVGSDEYWWHVATGDKYLYLTSSDELRAFSIEEEDDVWRYDVDVETVRQVGDRLYAFSDSVTLLG